MALVLMRSKSHRARRKLEHVLPGVDYYFIFGECPGELFYCPTDKVPEVLEIKGIARARVKGDPMKCWNLA